MSSYALLASKPLTIMTALKRLFADEEITDRRALDAWCGAANRRRLYAYLREQAPEHWARVANPKAATRGAYPSLLTGYGTDLSPVSDEEAAIIAEAKRRLAEEEATKAAIKEQRILAMMAELRIK